MLNLFNLAEEPRKIEAIIPAKKLQLEPGKLFDTFDDANVKWKGDNLHVSAEMAPMSPIILAFGQAVRDAKKTSLLH